MLQLDFFEKEDSEVLRGELQKVKESNDKVRKSLFAKHGELARNYLELQARLEIIEKNLCQVGNN